MINLTRELQKVIVDSLNAAGQSIVSYDRLKADAIYAELQATSERIATIFHGKEEKPVAQKPAKPVAKRKPTTKKAK